MNHNNICVVSRFWSASGIIEKSYQTHVKKVFSSVR